MVIHESAVLLPFSYHLFSEMGETKRKQNTFPSLRSLKDSGIDTKPLAMYCKLRPTKAASLTSLGRTSRQKFNISPLLLLVPKLLKYGLFRVILRGFSSLKYNCILFSPQNPLLSTLAVRSKTILTYKFLLINSMWVLTWKKKKICQVLDLFTITGFLCNNILVFFCKIKQFS